MLDKTDFPIGPNVWLDECTATTSDIRNVLENGIAVQRTSPAISYIYN